MVQFSVHLPIVPIKANINEMLFLERVICHFCEIPLTEEQTAVEALCGKWHPDCFQ